MNDPKTADQINSQVLGKVDYAPETLADYTTAQLRDQMKRAAALRLLVEKWRNEASAYFKAIDKHPSYEDVAFELKSSTLRQCAKELEDIISQ